MTLITKKKIIKVKLFKSNDFDYQNILSKYTREKGFLLFNVLWSGSKACLVHNFSHFTNPKSTFISFISFSLFIFLVNDMNPFILGKCIPTI